MNNPSSLQPTLRALADPTRREILEILKNGAMPAGEIAEHFSITGAAISHHFVNQTAVFFQSNVQRSLIFDNDFLRSISDIRHG